MSQSVQNPADKHHYIPQFYTRRWTGEDGLLEIFEKEGAMINIRRGSPKSTGYQSKLYAMEGFEGEEAAAFEKKFFEPADTKAARALQFMEKGKHVYSRELRSAWSRFLMSLLLRCPEDMAVMRAEWDKFLAETDPKLEAYYSSIREEGDPATMAEFIESRDEASAQQRMFDTYRTLIDNSRIGNILNNLQWSVFDLSDSQHRLLSSDRPLIRGNLGEENGLWSLPISPTLLFMGAKDSRRLNAMLKLSPDYVVRDTNLRVVERAVRYVYSADRSQARFISNRFGKKPEPQLIVGMFQRRPRIDVDAAIEQHRRIVARRRAEQDDAKESLN